MKQLNLYYIGGSDQRPEGRTVVPTDDIQIWLKCAGLNKPYTTLAEVLADSSTLEALIADSNAVDYLVRSKSFAGNLPLVPTMTSDTTPSGECITAHERTGNEAYKAFDGDSSTLWSGYAGETNQYVGYIFPSSKKIKKCIITFNQTPSSSSYTVPQTTWKIQKGSSWENVETFTLPASSVVKNTTITKVIDIDTDRVRIFSPDTIYVSGQYNTRIQEIQFYTEDGLCDNATAMSYIGLNNYASNTLLADSDWNDAIQNSQYFESVDNVKVPAMTSSNTPSGECFADSQYSSSYPPYLAFDGNDSTQWASVDGNTSPYPHYLGYRFDSPICIKKVKIRFGIANSHNTIKNFAIQASNNGSDYTDIFSGVANDSSSTYDAEYTLSNNNNYNYYRLYVTTSYAGTNACICNTLQFYGRADI